MQPNPALKRLGFADNDRVAIIHTDDIGMCFASVKAFVDLWEFGLISSGAVMVPCPWFLKAADYARQAPAVDLGVHSTITSEWPSYRWGPLSTREPASGLVDAHGFFYASTREVQAYAVQAYVEAELEAQVQQALRHGMQPTHMDTHMGAVSSLKLSPGYLKVCIQYRLPGMMFRMDAAAWQARGLDAQSAEMAVGLLSCLEQMGLPLMDRIFGMDLGKPDYRLEQAKQAFHALEPGITHFILHPSVDSPELREIAPDWRARVADYETFMSDELRRYIRSEGIQVIGYRALQDLMPDPAILTAFPL